VSIPAQSFELGLVGFLADGTDDDVPIGNGGFAERSAEARRNARDEE
jgi:hypothetical protein